MKRKLTHNLASQSVSQGNCNLADSILSSWAVEL